MGRTKIFTAEEVKERKKAYDIQYQINRARIDPEFREYKNRYRRDYMRKKRQEREPIYEMERIEV